jgi:hypothetical protein
MVLRITETAPLYPLTASVELQYKIDIKQYCLISPVGAEPCPFSIRGEISL